MPDDFFFMKEFLKQIPQKSQQKIITLFKLLDDIYDFAYAIVPEFNVHNLDSRELTIGSLYIETMHSFESVILSSQRGLDAPSKAMLRVLLETVFKLKLICIDPEFINEYIKSDDFNRAQLFNQVLLDNDEIFSHELKELAAEEFPKLQDVFRNKEYQMKPWKLAKRAGMYDFYLLVYIKLSDDVHTSIRSLEKYYGLNNEGTVTHMIMEPIFGDLIMVALTACSILVEALKCTSDFFELSYKEKLENYIDELKKFDEVEK